MKTISLWQPYASLIALGEKKIETRSWQTNYRGSLAIHATMLNPFKAIELIPDFIVAEMRKVLKERGVLTSSTDFRVLPRGCVVATTRLVDCVQIGGFDKRKDSAYLETGYLVTGNEYHFGDYTPGRWAWILEDIQPLKEPVAAVGHQGLWEWKEGDVIVKKN